MQAPGYYDNEINTSILINEVVTSDHYRIYLMSILQVST